MALHRKRIGTLVLRLLTVLSLLGCPQIGSAAGTWSVISLPLKPGEVISPKALATDAVGALYVAGYTDTNILQADRWIQKRDLQGNWSIIATGGTGLSQVRVPTALAVDPFGSLYVVETHFIGNFLVQKRDAQGNWSVIAEGINTSTLAADAAGNLYVAETYPSRIQKLDAQGNWSVIAPRGEALGQVLDPTALAVDADNLYVADTGTGYGRIQKRDAQGKWSMIATGDDNPTALAVDANGNLYVADKDVSGNDRIQKRDTQGTWSLLAGIGTGLGQVLDPRALAVDAAGNLYVADTGNHRAQKYTPSP